MFVVFDVFQDKEVNKLSQASSASYYLNSKSVDIPVDKYNKLYIVRFISVYSLDELP